MELKELAIEALLGLGFFLFICSIVFYILKEDEKFMARIERDFKNQQSN